MRKLINLVAFAALLLAPWKAQAQFCTPSPSSMDGSGITYVSFGLGDETVNGNVSWSASPYYNDYRSQVGAVPAGNSCEMSLTYATGYSYGTIVWVDWNNDSTFSGSEVVWVGESSNSNPTTLTVSFDIPVTQDTGMRMMRICAADMAFDSYTGSVAAAAGVNPCDSYSWGVALDYTLHILEAPTCLRPESLTATDITGNGLTLHWVDTLNSGASYSILYWKDGGDTATVTSASDSYTFSDLEANSLYHFTVKAVCSPTDESLSLGGSFATGCSGSTCELTVTAAGGYSGSVYSPTLTLWQNGRELAAVNDGTESVTVCSGDTVLVLYTDAPYAWASRSATVLDGGGSVLFDGATTSYSTGDTLLTIGAPCPSCIPPAGLHVEEADETSVTLGWTPRSGATLFALYMNDSVVSESVTDTFYSFTGLASNTAYTFGVQAICAEEDTANMATITARTSCGEMTIPFTDDFDSYDNGFWPPCWHRLRAYGTDPSVNAQYHHSGSQAMFLLAADDTTLFCTPSAIPLAGNEIQVRYFAFLNYASYYNEEKWIKGGVMTDTSDMSTFIALDSVGYHNFNDVFEEREFNTSGLDATAEYWVAWMFYSSNNGYGYYNRGAIDDVSITQLSDCVRPAAATTEGVGARQATVSWNSVDGSSNFIVVYHTANDPASDDAQTVSVSGDTSVTLTGLTPETHYYAWVATDCGGIYSDFRPAGDFTTLISCPAVNNLTVIDSLTTSESATISWSAGDVETEWEVILDSNDAVSVNDTFYVATGLEALTGHTVYVRAVCGADDTSAFQSVNFATACDEAICNFTVEMTDSYGDGWNGGAVEFYQAGVEVGSATLTGGSNGTDAVEVCSSAAVELRVKSGSYPSEMSFTVHDGGGSVVYTAAQGSITASSNGSVLTTIAVPCPNCIMPTALVVDTTTATDATISWSRQEGQNAWIVLLDGTYVNVTDTFYTFTGLTARTSYTASVATDCGGDTSSFATVTFATACAGGSCDLTVTSTASYVYSGYYCPTVHVWQNGVEAASVNNAVETVEVCTGMPVTLVYEAPQYNYYTPMVTVLDGGDEEVFNGSTEGYSTGDTLLVMPNACPSCLSPRNLHASYIDSNMISIEWNAVEGIYDYLVSFNGGPYTANGGSNVYSEYMLNSNTAYTFSVKVYCAPGDTSNARTITVKTGCGMMALPYSESFENDNTGDVPSCWNVTLAGSNGNPAVRNTPNSGSNSLRLSTNDTCMIASSAIPVAGDSIQISFWAKADGGTLEAGVMTNPVADSTFIPMVTVSSNVYSLYQFNTNGLDHFATYYLAFRYIDYTGYDYHGDIDDINIIRDEGCMYPSNLAAATTSYNAVITWTNTGVVSYFAVEHRLAGESDWTYDASTSNTTYTLDPLNAASTYEVRIGLICGNDTLWTEYTFVTDCGQMSVPYFEDFEASSSMPPCWTYDAGVQKFDGGAFWSSSHGNGGTIAVVPELLASITKLQVSFDVKMGPPSENDAVLIGVADNSGTLLGWLDTLTDPNQSRSAFVNFTVYFTNYNIPGGATRVAFGHTYNGPDWFLLDNINIIELPDCYPVANIVGANLNDIENTTFSWTPQGEATTWQVYVDTVTVGIDSVENLPASSFTTVTDTFYTIPIGVLSGGGIYNFFVRSDCGMQQSNWASYEFGAGSIVMNNSTVADTVTGCGFVVYDNGGPIAGYITNSNSALVLRSENVGSELEVFGGKFGFGSSAATLTIYDGEGTSGTVLYTYNTIDGRDTLLNTVLATSTTGALTITFSAGTFVHTGYELYVHCVGAPTCPRPTELQATMTSATQATATWTSTAANFNFYYRIAGAATWVRQTVATNSVTLTGLLPDTTYDMYVVALCSAEDSSTASAVRQFSSHYVEPCVTPTDLAVSDITVNSAIVSWTAGGSETLWTLEVNGSAIDSVTSPYSLVDLAPATDYNVRVRSICNDGAYSDWSDMVGFTTEPLPTYTVSVSVNDESMGTVTLSSDGPYEEGSSVTLTAIPANNHQFVNWNDGNTENPRTIVVTSDTAFTAIFAQIEGIDGVDATAVAIYPNPASSTVTISGVESGAVVTIVDMNGREIAGFDVRGSKLDIDVSGYAKGAYFVRIAGSQTIAIRKLIVE